MEDVEMTGPASSDLIAIELPIEILGHIVSCLPQNGLKQARLVSKSIEYFATRKLFCTVNLKVTLESFMNLEKISLHEDLRKFVRRVFYDGRLLSWDFESFREYATEGIGHGMHFTIPSDSSGLRTLTDEETEDELQDRYASMEDFTESFTDLQKVFHHQQYCRYIMGQKHLHRGNNEVILLRDCFRKFPNLSEIEFNSGTNITPQSGIHIDEYDDQKDHHHQMRQLSSTCRMTLVAPKNTIEDDFFNVNRLRALMTAAQEAERRIFKLEAGRLDTEDIERKLPEPMNIFNNLTRAKLDFVGNSLSLAQIGRILKDATLLEHLDLTFGSVEIDSQFTQLLTHPEAFGNLKELTLRDFNVKLADLTVFLEAHVRTLKCLHLHSVFLCEGNFVNFVEFLSNSMRLKDVRFRGSVGNPKSQTWICSTTDRYNFCFTTPKWSEPCLLRQVELFAIHDGPSPFKKRQPEKSVIVECDPVWDVEVDGTFVAHRHNMPSS